MYRGTLLILLPPAFPSGLLTHFDYIRDVDITEGLLQNLAPRELEVTLLPLLTGLLLRRFLGNLYPPSCIDFSRTGVHAAVNEEATTMAVTTSGGTA
jgi:hypothetical protein